MNRLPPNKIGVAKEGGNRPQVHDLFISYSHSDRSLVENFASALRARRIRGWFDGWEMKPGDVLRERISAGIDNTSFFLVILSPEALASNWVKYELNSGMVHEIERGHVRVIPAMARDVTVTDLPADLRSKFCLDLRTAAARRLAVDAVVDLVQPEKRLRKELMASLRSPTDHTPATIALLREYANRYGDQGMQSSALRGLAKIKTPAATLVIAERVFDDWGVQAIKVALRMLARNRDSGGLLALTALIFDDLRFLHDKINLICDLVANDEPDVTHLLRQHAHHGRGIFVRLADIFDKATDLDLRHGSRLAASIGHWELYDRPPLAAPHELAMAEAYANHRMPGLVDLLRSRM
ncbi:toll/interleukin-1 receptor domain-containing protein [Micromonospora sp. CA-246542]|uniref:toll/interleukin-1 receptor domain-containing protein n=1 Tax=Micromonospora sp. CA-246542 TaxID=3239959 RepID=UPI003D8A2215